MSWESTSIYYQLLNQRIGERLGGLHSADCLLSSVNFAEVEAGQRRGDWARLAQLLTERALSLEAAGAEALLICSNTMHKVAGELAAGVGIPLLHIADATGRAVQQAGLHRVGLLGTRFTMEQDFHLAHLARHFGLEPVTPAPDDRETVHRVIYDELCLGRINAASRQGFLDIIGRLPAVEGVIFGCTEIGLLVRPEDLSVPVFDSTRLHVEQAVDWALSSD